jgi:hypothetical protein
MEFPEDYEKRVYAGLLGKIIGVCMGRPVENWSCEPSRPWTIASLRRIHRRLLAVKVR